MTSKVPWAVDPNPWGNEAKFITWVRGILRKGWSVHPIKIEYLKQNKKRIANTNPKSAKTHPTVWGYVCECCRKETPQGDCEVDHVTDVQGKFTTMSEIEAYARHLFMIDFDSIRILCKPCHSIESYRQKLNITFAEAVVEKQIIEICNKPVKEIVAFCQDYGYNASELSNKDKRRSAVTEILKGVE